jgi:hypothetical protein
MPFLLHGGNVDLSQPDLSQSQPLPPHAVRLVATTFGLAVADVRADARDVATRPDPNDDDLLATIETRRRLEATKAATYLRILRTALAPSRLG